VSVRPVFVAPVADELLVHGRTSVAPVDVPIAYQYESSPLSMSDEVAQFAESLSGVYVVFMSAPVPS